jgi:RNA polymerase sigma factor (sigma-70 family)
MAQPVLPRTVPGPPGPRERSRLIAERHLSGNSAPLPAGRERDLVAATEAGDREATEQLVKAFLPAIDGVAYHYRGFPSLDATELRQEGVVGLLRAAKRYDCTFGTPFWGYASWWVRQAMQHLVAELTGPVVLSDRAARHLVHVKQARLEYQQAHRREASIADLATATDLPRDQIESLLAMERAPRGLEERAPGADEGAATFVERLADPLTDEAYERVADSIEVERLRDLTAGLLERERQIVFSHYGIDCRRQTLREIGQRLDLSVERVRQLEERALEKLRQVVAWPPEDSH